MVKRRPAVVISPRLPYREGLCTVVPLSTTPPPHAVPYVVQLELKPHPPKPFDPGGLRVAWPDQAGAGPRALIYPSKNRAAPKASLPTAQEAI